MIMRRDIHTMIGDAGEVHKLKWGWLRERKAEGQNVAEYRRWYENARGEYVVHFPTIGESGLDTFLNAFDGKGMREGDLPRRLVHGRDLMWVPGALTCYLYRGFTIYSFFPMVDGLTQAKRMWSFCLVEDMELDSDTIFREQRSKIVTMIDQIVREPRMLL